jgi:hypothetical protein
MTDDHSLAIGRGRYRASCSPPKEAPPEPSSCYDNPATKTRGCRNSRPKRSTMSGLKKDEHMAIQQPPQRPLPHPRQRLERLLWSAKKPVSALATTPPMSEPKSRPRSVASRTYAIGDTSIIARMVPHEAQRPIAAPKRFCRREARCGVRAHHAVGKIAVQLELRQKSSRKSTLAALAAHDQLRDPADGPSICAFGGHPPAKVPIAALQTP